MGVLEIELAGINSGEFDVLSITGQATLGGILEVSFLDGFLPEIGDTFDILTAGLISGEFDVSQLMFPTMSGRTFELDYGANYVRLNTVASAVPLPLPLWLMISGVMVLFRTRE